MFSIIYLATTASAELSVASETKVPVYRYWAGSIGDHFYTRRLEELGYGEDTVYNWEGIAFYLIKDDCDECVPLYRYYKAPPVFDHFYTTSGDEIGTTQLGETGENGYIHEGLVGHCYPVRLSATKYRQTYIYAFAQ